MIDKENYSPLINLEVDEKISNYISKNDGNCYTENPSYLLPYGKVLPESWLLVELYRNNVIKKSDFNFMRTFNCLIFYSRIQLFPTYDDFINGYNLKEKLSWTDLSSNQRDIFVYEK